MLRALRRWLDKRKEDNQTKAYRRGYSWASQELAKGVSVDEIEAFTYGRTDWFDLGVNQFLHDHFNQEARAPVDRMNNKGDL